jgi:hypothetical protein
MASGMSDPIQDAMDNWFRAPRGSKKERKWFNAFRRKLRAKYKDVETCRTEARRRFVQL